MGEQGLHSGVELRLTVLLQEKEKLTPEETRTQDRCRVEVGMVCRLRGQGVSGAVSSLDRYCFKELRS
jgi:hypothetical protein